MKVLVACEFSGVVREAFRKRGHDAISCDLAETEIPGPHIRGDVREVLNDGWDLMIAHPPCTYLTITANRWFTEEHLLKEPERRQWREDAVDFFMELQNAPIEHKAIENPKGIISSRFRKPDQIIHPWQFGHDAAKGTCLWLTNLPPLKATNVVDVTYVMAKNGTRKYSKWWYDVSYLPSKGGIREKARNTTFQGIADAMAEQWG